MPNALLGVVRNGKIELTQSADLPEGASVLVTMLADDELQFWRGVSDRSLASVWDNTADDVYAELLKK
jgi:hypothetical protein